MQHSSCKPVITSRVEYSVDADQMTKPSDQHPYCILLYSIFKKKDKSGFSMTRVKIAL